MTKKDPFAYIYPCTTATIILVALKLTVLDWSWWIILIPLWLPILIRTVAISIYIAKHWRE